jgi:hypothetical protein
LEHLCGFRVCRRHLSKLVKKLLKSPGLAYQDHLAVSFVLVGPSVRNITRCKDASTDRQMILLAANLKDESTAQNVIPLIFAVVNVKSGA